MDHYLQWFSNAVITLLTYLNAHFSMYGWIMLLVFFVLLLVVLKLAEEPRAKKKPLEQLHDTHDFNAIAGDDLVTTQLDLARAYIEMDNKALAKQILQQVLRQGSTAQQQEAERLLECV